MRVRRSMAKKKVQKLTLHILHINTHTHIQGTHIGGCAIQLSVVTTAARYKYTNPSLYHSVEK